MNKKECVSEILKTFELEDRFQDIDLNKHDIEKIDHLLTPFLDDCQNESPSLAIMISLCKKYNGIMDCYIVNTDRDDTRFSCEGIVFKSLNEDEMIYLVNQYRFADEMNLESTSNGKFFLRLWWD